MRGPAPSSPARLCWAARSERLIIQHPYQKDTRAMQDRTMLSREASLSGLVRAAAQEDSHDRGEFTLPGSSTRKGPPCPSEPIRSSRTSWLIRARRSSQTSAPLLQVPRIPISHVAIGSWHHPRLRWARRNWWRETARVALCPPRLRQVTSSTALVLCLPWRWYWHEVEEVALFNAGDARGHDLAHAHGHHHQASRAIGLQFSWTLTVN